MSKFLLIFWLAITIPASAFAFSDAATKIINGEIKTACDAGGHADPSGVIERDLTGDGLPDLIVDHQSINCAASQRSNSCGFRACSILFFVRQGESFLDPYEVLSIGAEIDNARIPNIKLMGHNFEVNYVRWNGKVFASVKKPKK